MFEIVQQASLRIPRFGEESSPSKQARAAQFITYAPAAWKWLGIVGWGSKAIRADFARWIASASIQERQVFGFPPPGHSYWTDETVAGVSARYPAMDMTPYRA